MIIDTSAIIAILRDEEDAKTYTDAIVDADECLMSTATYQEAAAAIDSCRNPIASRKLDDLIKHSCVEITSVTGRQAELARAAYRDFGLGSGHPAKLNFGDTFAYALAKDANQPLLFKGADFIHTDVVPAVEGSVFGTD